MKYLFELRDFCMKAYKIPLKTWIITAAIILTAWTLLMLLFRKQKGFRLFLSRIFASLGLFLIVLMTFVRYPNQGTGLIWIPLRPLFGMRVSSDYWFVSITNLILYIPFACGLSFSGDGEKKKGAIGKTILICFLVSLAAESYQYTTASGLAEVDDVLFNTLGGLIGAIPRVLLPEEKKDAKAEQETDV